MCIAYKAVLSLVPNRSAMAAYLSKLAIYHRNISRRSSSGVWAEPPVDVRHKMPDIFCWVHIEEIFSFRPWTLTLSTLKKVLNSSRWKWETTFLVYFFCLCLSLGIFCHFNDDLQQGIKCLKTVVEWLGEGGGLMLNYYFHCLCVRGGGHYQNKRRPINKRLHPTVFEPLLLFIDSQTCNSRSPVIRRVRSGRGACIFYTPLHKEQDPKVNPGWKYVYSMILLTNKLIIYLSFVIGNFLLSS